MSGRLKLYVGLILLGVFARNTIGQEYHLGRTLAGILNKGLPGTYIQGYMQAFATAMGTAVNSGSFHSAKVNFFPHVEIGLDAISMSLPDEARYFSFNGEQQPTFFGPQADGSAGVPGSGLTKFTLPQLQVDIGMFSFFQASLRATKYKIDQMGEIQLFGLGVKYGLSDLVTIDFLPLEVSVQAFYHAFSIEEWLSSGTFAINLQNSVELSFIPVEVFAGLGYERVSLKIKTNNLPDVGANGVGDILLDGKNGVRISAGLGLQLMIFNLHGEYNYGFYHSAAGGISIRF